MSLLLALLGGAPPVDDKLYADFTEENLHLDFDADFEFSFTYGPMDDDVLAAINADADDNEVEEPDHSFFASPLSDDVVVVQDQLVNTFEDDEPADDTDHSFSFTLTEDAQLYAAQFESEEAPSDEAGHDFAASPLADDFVAADDKVYSAAIDDEMESDTGDDFTLALLDDAQVYSFALDDDAPVEDGDFDFAMSLQDEFTVVQPTFDDFGDYAENDENEYSFYLGNVADDVVVAPDVPLPGGGGYKKKKRRVIAYYKRHLIDEHGNFIKVPTEEEFEATVAGLSDKADEPVVASTETLKAIEEVFTKALKKRQQSKKDFDYKTIRTALGKAQQASREAARQMATDDELMFVIALAT